MKRVVFCIAGLMLATHALAQADTPVAATPMASAPAEPWMEKPWQLELSKRQAEQLGLTIASDPKLGRVMTAPHWVFHADGTMEAKGLWQGTWRRGPHSRLLASVTPAGQTAPVEMEIQFAPGGKTGLYIRFSEGLVGTGRLIETGVAGASPAATVPGVASTPSAVAVNDVQPRAATPGGEPPAPSMDELFDQLAAQFDKAGSSGVPPKRSDLDNVFYRAKQPGSIHDNACFDAIYEVMGGIFDDTNHSSYTDISKETVKAVFPTAGGQVLWRPAALWEKRGHAGIRLSAADKADLLSDRNAWGSLTKESIAFVPNASCDRVFVRNAYFWWDRQRGVRWLFSYADIRMSFLAPQTYDTLVSFRYKAYIDQRVSDFGESLIDGITLERLPPLHVTLAPRGYAVQKDSDGRISISTKGLRKNYYPGRNAEQLFGMKREDGNSAFYPNGKDLVRSQDDWAPGMKATIASWEAARDKKLAEEAAREAEQRRLDELAADRRRKQEQARLDAALNAKTAQAMYLAAGKYEREGDDYNARQVYERLIDRFPDSPFAAKANDQLLERKREERASSDLRDARSEQGRRAFEACRIEMDACYSQNGSNCWRDCEKLR